MKLFIAAVWITGLCSVAGCVSQPTAVKANLPLVATGQSVQLKQTSSSTVEQQAKAIPELTISAGKTVIENTQYRVSEPYLSALGLTCYQLVALEQTNENASQTKSRTLCQKQNFWLLYPATTTFVAQ